MAFVYLLPTGFALLNGVNTAQFNSFCVFSSTLLGEMAQQTIIRTLFLQMVQFQKLQENRRKKRPFLDITNRTETFGNKRQRIEESVQEMYGS